MHRLAVLVAALSATLLLGNNAFLSASVSKGTEVLGSVYQVYAEASAPEATDAQKRANYRMWARLCTEYRREVDCSDMAMPRVELFRPNPWRPGLQGYYRGGDVVYVRSDLYAGRFEEVLVHEQSHYMDMELGLFGAIPAPYSDHESIFKLCDSERRAWAITDTYNGKELWGSRKHIGERWVNWYKHCKPHRDRLYPPQPEPADAPASD